MKKLGALFLTTALLLTGCTPVGGETDTEEAVVVRYGISNAWDSLMPYNSPSGSNYSRMIYDKLYDRLAFVHADGSLSPRGAKSWESADDGYSVRFRLDENAAFHDGEPVTARHWADTILRMTDPDCPTLGRSAFAVLAGTDDGGSALPGETVGVTVEDEYTLKLTFKVPTTPEDFLLDKNREYYVLPTHLMEDVAAEDTMEMELWSAPVGSGPCKFFSEVMGSSLVLSANEEYHLGAPGFDQLDITVMDKNSLLTALIAGDLDYYAIGGRRIPGGGGRGAQYLLRAHAQQREHLRRAHPPGHRARSGQGAPVRAGYPGLWDGDGHIGAPHLFQLRRGVQQRL